MKKDLNQKKSDLISEKMNTIKTCLNNKNNSQIIYQNKIDRLHLT